MLAYVWGDIDPNILIHVISEPCSQRRLEEARHPYCKTGDFCVSMVQAQVQYAPKMHTSLCSVS